VEEQVAVIYAGVNGYLDGIEVNQVRAFEDGLLSVMRNEHKDVLEAIRDKKALDDEITSKLKAAVEGFAKNFA
jgi:F-type H+-transporting ATPase subunit alpha